MKFNHMVNLDGVYYAAGEEVPIELGGAEEVEPTAPEPEEVEEPKPTKRRGRPRRE